MSLLITFSNPAAISLAAGQSLVVKDMSGSSSLSPTTIAREDASARIGAGFFVYGPVTADVSVMLTTTGQSFYNIVQGDPTPADRPVLFDPGNPPSSGPNLSPDAAGAVRGAQRSKLNSSCTKYFSGAGNAATADFTIANQVPAKRLAKAVQLIYANWGATAYTVSAKVRAATTHLGNGNGNGGEPVAVTFFGGNSVPAALGGTVNSIVPGLLVSDMVGITMLARTDSPAKSPLLQVRTYSADAQSAVFGVDLGTFNTAIGSNDQWGSGTLAGDQVTAWTNAATPMTITEGTSRWIQPAAVRFFYDIPSFTLAVAGDSLFRGQGSSANSYGWAQRLPALLGTSSQVFDVMNFGWSGQIHAASMLMARRLIALTQPNMICIAAFSPNDTSPSQATQASLDSNWAETLLTIDYARQHGVKVAVATSGPVNFYTTADALLKAQNAKVRALASEGVIVLDHAAVLENPANPARILPAYDSGDGIHYSDAGYAALAAADAPVLRPYIG